MKKYLIAAIMLLSASNVVSSPEIGNDAADLLHEQLKERCIEEVNNYHDDRVGGETIVYLGCISQAYRSLYLSALDQYQINSMHSPAYPR